jgi:hypothetical protein
VGTWQGRSAGRSLRGRREIDASGALVLPGGTARAGYSAYDGWEVYGWPRFTISRGQVLLEDGEVMAPPDGGQWLRRANRPPDGVAAPRDPAIWRAAGPGARLTLDEPGDGLVH